MPSTLRAAAASFQGAIGGFGGLQDFQPFAHGAVFLSWLAGIIRFFDFAISSSS